MKTEEFTVRIVSDDSVETSDYLWDVLSQIESVEGISSIVLEEGSDNTGSEISRILDGISEENLSKLEDTIEQWTDEK